MKKPNDSIEGRPETQPMGISMIISMIISVIARKRLNRS
jgi:hypothetical protein